MKKCLLLTFLLSLMVSFKTNAQYIPKEEDWFFYDLSYNMLLNVPQGYENVWRSNGHNISIMDDMIFGTSNFSFAYGLTYSSQNYHSNLNVSADSITGAAHFRYLNPDKAYKTNKFTLQYFEIPLELRYRSKPNNKGKFFRFYIGGRLGIRFNGYSKYKDDDYNVRYYNMDEFNRWRAGVYTRIGYNYFSLYAYYGLTPIFTKGDINGETLTNAVPLSLGISLSL